MALGLESTASYSLITQAEGSENKDIIFVKLTDSCVKAIEEFLKGKAATDSGPSICFDGANGHITIPSKREAFSEGFSKQFNFSCSPLVQTNERHGVLECLQQPRSGNKTLLSLGQLQKKINIMGTEDAYEMTRTRMAQVDKEKKEVRTKEIRINHMKKVSKKSHVIPPVNAKLLALSGKKKAVVPSGNSGSISLDSLKERVLYLLALRPMKKMEIVGRLQRDGVNPKDTSQICSVLEQVASFQDNTYKLHRRLYNDLQPEKWPHYSELEKQAVRRNIASTKRQDASPTVSSTTKSPEGGALQKRIASDQPAVVSKKPRIAHSSEETHNNNTTGFKPPQDKSRIAEGAPAKVDLKSNTSEMQTISPCDGRQETGSTREESPPVVASTSKSPDYLSKYTPITSYEQRCKYKQEFQAGYREYIELKKNIDAISTKFMELDRSWRRCCEDSSEAQRIQDEIYRLYNEYQKDDKYQDMKKRYQELHVKLSHIKQLVVIYDKSSMEDSLGM